MAVAVREQVCPIWMSCWRPAATQTLETMRRRVGDRRMLTAWGLDLRAVSLRAIFVRYRRQGFGDCHNQTLTLTAAAAAAATVEEP